SDSFTSALGYVVLSFASLEQTASRSIMQMFGPAEAIGAAVAAELPFAKKIHLLATLVRLNLTGRSFETAGKDPNEVFAAVLADCLRAEELRNTVMHSSWESV